MTRLTTGIQKLSNLDHDMSEMVALVLEKQSGRRDGEFASIISRIGPETGQSKTAQPCQMIRRWQMAKRRKPSAGPKTGPFVFWPPDNEIR